MINFSRIRRSFIPLDGCTVRTPKVYIISSCFRNDPSTLDPGWRHFVGGQCGRLPGNPGQSEGRGHTTVIRPQAQPGKYVLLILNAGKILKSRKKLRDERSAKSGLPGQALWVDLKFHHKLLLHWWWRATLFTTSCLCFAYSLECEDAALLVDIFKYLERISMS